MTAARSRHVVIRRPALLYAALLAALIVAWAVPPSSLLSLSSLPRFFAAVLVFVALLYGLAFLTGRRHLRIAGPADARTPQTTSTA